MAVPRNRLSNSRKNLRRAHHAKEPLSLASCGNCGSKVQAHRACMKCGHYRGRQVVKGTDSE